MNQCCKAANADRDNYSGMLRCRTCGSLFMSIEHDCMDASERFELFEAAIPEGLHKPLYLCLTEELCKWINANGCDPLPYSAVPCESFLGQFLAEMRRRKAETH